ncbi:MAG: Ribonuclease E [Alphaproteobacteria bacterium MarineAlpha12_Bin1]|jgi:ribonuclease E|nr:MAG: Ribonuclease E [Alphaproteobacteria bacterium MarineAlpha12_Bin1]|tara:strand:+ start:4668 stop:7022 length:2355 start_codon:yes stop_codon:yes gene_type:complete
MTKKILIDATHSEETRVVVAENSDLLEFDYETTTKRQLKGNIYLAKVTRVEPSLQAAFVEFGGKRHGFLAFNEIHPDYYRIPVEDKEALIAETDISDDTDELYDDVSPVEEEKPEKNELDQVEVLGGNAEEDIAELGDAHRKRLRKLTRMYKIQEVIKRRQILLIQVVKEERGNKGAALTTYLSLPGRYCVLMPNTSRGGGISRKVSNLTHRKRMKTIMSNLEIPEGMAVIMRTAGVERNKAEIRRDYEYLRRTWDNIREQTLQSSAPALIYEEGDLIKRSLRDVYNRDIEEIIVDGEEAYKSARLLMRTMMPSHVKRVKKHANPNIPLFNHFGIESQIDEIYDPIVSLKSGGYIVINPTEALVAIDVNSGKATRERNVEQTARKTNLEAADEVARQLRLRDLAGLVVIDFIDMDENRNITAVERRMKEAMKADRARIQVGRISQLGLMELSRQRLRPSIHEVSAQICIHCGGSGYIRSTESTVLRVLRAIEEEGTRNRSKTITIKVPSDVAIYVLNQKRDVIKDLESRFNFRVFITVDSDLTPPDYIMERTNVNAPDDEVISETIDSRSLDLTSTNEDRSQKHKQRRREKSSEQVEAKDDSQTQEDSKTDETGKDTSKPSPRRRGRRGGRRRRKADDNPLITNAETKEASLDEDKKAQISPKKLKGENKVEPLDTSESLTSESDKAITENKPKRKRPRRRPQKLEADSKVPKKDKKINKESTSDSKDGPVNSEHTNNIPQDKNSPENELKKNKQAKGKKEATIDNKETEKKRPKRSGWWSRGP